MSEIKKTRRAHGDLGVEGPVIAFESLKIAIQKKRPFDQEKHDLYEALEWLAESLRELHFKVDKLMESQLTSQLKKS